MAEIDGALVPAEAGSSQSNYTDEPPSPAPADDGPEIQRVTRAFPAPLRCPKP